MKTIARLGMIFLPGTFLAVRLSPCRKAGGGGGGGGVEEAVYDYTFLTI